MPERPPALLDMPGLAGPSILGTVLVRNLLHMGYGLNVLIAGGGSVSFLLGPSVARSWAIVVVLCAFAAAVGLLINDRMNHSALELVATIVLLATFTAQCTAVVFCWVLNIGPNGLLPFWWPAALGYTALWRIRNIVKTDRAREAARSR